jgi:hypothetical protein
MNYKACANPLLYGWLNDNFRKEFRRIGWSFIAKRRNQTGARDMSDKPPGEMLTDKVGVKRMDVSVIVEIRADDHQQQHQPLTVSAASAPSLIVCAGSPQSSTLHPAAAALLAVPSSNLAHYQNMKEASSTVTAESDVIHLTVPQ